MRNLDTAIDHRRFNDFKVHCFSGARVSDFAHLVPIVNADRSATVIIHAGTNNIRLRRSETLKKDFISLHSRIRSTAHKIVISGPLPVYNRGIEAFSRLFSLNDWLKTWCFANNLDFIDNWDCFWGRPLLFRRDGLHPSRNGTSVLADSFKDHLLL